MKTKIISFIRDLHLVYDGDDFATTLCEYRVLVEYQGVPYVVSVNSDNITDIVFPDDFSHLTSLREVDLFRCTYKTIVDSIVAWCSPERYCGEINVMELCKDIIIDFKKAGFDVDAPSEQNIINEVINIVGGTILNSGSR